MFIINLKTLSQFLKSLEFQFSHRQNEESNRYLTLSHTSIWAFTEHSTSGSCYLYGKNLIWNTTRWYTCLCMNLGKSSISFFWGLQEPEFSRTVPLNYWYFQDQWQGTWSNILTRLFTETWKESPYLTLPNTPFLLYGTEVFSRWQPNLVTTLCCFKHVQPKTGSLVYESSKDLDSYTHTPHTHTHLFVFHIPFWFQFSQLLKPNMFHHQATEYTAFSVWYTLFSTYCLTSTRFGSLFLWVTFFDFSKAGLGVVLCAPLQPVLLLSSPRSFICLYR